MKAAGWPSEDAIANFENKQKLVVFDIDAYKWRPETSLTSINIGAFGAGVLFFLFFSWPQFKISLYYGGLSAWEDEIIKKKTSKTCS